MPDRGPTILQHTQRALLAILEDPSIDVKHRLEASAQLLKLKHVKPRPRVESKQVGGRVKGNTPVRDSASILGAR
jgi:hypothetical protein